MKKGLVFALLLAFMLAACEKFERLVYENEDAVCCGVSDPMHNIPWLKDLGDAAQEKISESKNPFRMTYMLFSNDSTGENMIVEEDDQSPRVVWVHIYDCEGLKKHEGYYSISSGDLKKHGTKLASAHVSPAPCATCPQFFETHLFVDTLAYYSITLK